MIYLGFVGFITFTMEGIAKTIYYITEHSLYNSKIWLASLILLDVAALVGSICIILILGVGNVDAVLQASMAALDNLRFSTHLAPEKGSNSRPIGDGTNTFTPSQETHTSEEIVELKAMP